MNTRNYLIFEDTKSDDSLYSLFNSCIEQILAGTIHVNQTRAKAGYPSHDCFRVNGQELIVHDVLKFYLSGLGGRVFSFEDTQNFTEKMRPLCNWYSFSMVLNAWIKRVLEEPFFDSQGHLKSEELPYQLPEAYFQYACYIAITIKLYGASYESYGAQKILDYVTALGSNLPKQIKTYGSGNLPAELISYRDEQLSWKANDAYATIRITIKEVSEANYHTALELLCRLLKTGFPASYSIDFRSPEKNWLPIKGLPKKGVHNLFATAVQWPSLHPLIEEYALLAMQADHWYQNLSDEHCALPGSFAVFALGLDSENHQDLICQYLAICDGEHQEIHGKFVLAYIEKYGFSTNGIELVKLCQRNIQHLPKRLDTFYKKFKQENQSSSS